MRGSLAAVLGLAGCSQIFGLDAPTRIDAAPDTPTAMVTGRVFGRYLHSDGAFNPVVDEYIYAEVDGEAIMDNGSEVPIAWQADGSFSFERRSDRYTFRLIGTVTGATPIEYQMTSAQLQIASFLQRHPDGRVASPGTTLTYRVTDAANGPIYAYSLGQWSIHPRTGGLPTDFTLDWANGGWPGQPALLDIARNDRVLFTQLAQAPEGYSRVARFRLDTLMMEDGMNHQITGTSLPLAPTRCVQMRLPAATEATRLAGAGITGTSASWYVQIYPTLTMGFVHAPTMALQAVSPLGDVDRSVQYGTPIAGDTVINLTVTSTRPIARGALTPFVVTQGTAQLAKAGADCTTTTTLDGGVAVPTDVRLGSVDLEADEQVVSISPSEPVELTWRLGGGGSADIAVVSLYELADGGGVTRLVKRADFLTTAQRVSIAGSYFERGKTYVTSIATTRGIAAAADGDLRVLDMPYAVAFRWPGTFVVAL